MLSIQPRRRDGRNEELRAVCVLPRVRHRQQARLRVVQLEVLVLGWGSTGLRSGGRTVVLTREFSAVDRALLPRGVRLAQVAALEHEVGDDAMEVVARVSEAVLSCSELTEVARGLGDDIVVQLECDPASSLVVDGDIKLTSKPYRRISVLPEVHKDALTKTLAMVFVDERGQRKDSNLPGPR